MQKIAVSIAICLVGAPCFAGSARYECVRASEPIDVDGKMDEAAWQKAEPIADFIVWWTADWPAKTKTVARLCYDDDYIYGVFDCKDPDLYAKYDKRDGYLWESDAVEFFFQPDAQCTTYYEFEIAPNGAILDARFPRVGAPGGIDTWAKWNCDIEVAVHVAGTL
ncbi:MAG TPA: carbohydrate-binding family 9-like protein, partial [Candidatus Hydrogenedentes bacterium]|nr:carbohydrate-binding family 9-like protein [Candidatus Hydrogenedentota bacterium]